MQSVKLHDDMVTPTGFVAVTCAIRGVLRSAPSNEHDPFAVDDFNVQSVT